MQTNGVYSPVRLQFAVEPTLVGPESGRDTGAVAFAEASQTWNGESDDPSDEKSDQYGASAYVFYAFGSPYRQLSNAKDIHHNEHPAISSPLHWSKSGIIFILMNKEEIGLALVARRNELRITQARLARVSGVSVHTLSNLETGEGNVTLDTLLKVVTTLGFKVRVGV